MSKEVKRTQEIKRCTKCVLPSSVPNIDFNEKGECTWCQSNFPNYIPLGREALQNLLEQNKNTKAPADCLVGVSGGKDSSYVALELKHKFGVRVEAFTYVHDGLTDFALQNAKTVCQALGIRHHLVSLPAHRHIASFKAFFNAWVNSEAPIAATMTCVACKHLHILGTRLAKQRGIPVVVWSACPLEEPPFILAASKETEVSKTKGMFALASILVKSLCTQREFRRAFFKDIPTCVFGSLAFRPGTGYLRLRYSSVKRLNFFDYCSWDEDRILTTLKTHTNWAIPEWVVSDWHSDCLFNVFKEYMFQKMIGVSYTDAFLSNKIRHKLITREQALEELLRSKEYYAKELIKTLPILGLDHLSHKLDPSCFKITSLE